ncbi:MAG: alcohol dehydrogenase catalytic domain-containing protein [Armatimonadetes bacterium]|nr:alcohol dehydrogenase catalytic domain-containing protein [Armatimonadota bacterium]
MKSRGLFGRKYLQIECRERELAPLGDDDVLVKVHACGVCGTDVNFVRDWDDEPMGLGHEIAAEVIEAGKAVARFQPGDRVIVEDCTMCGVCEDCKSGHPEFCRNMYGIEGQPGMGEYMVVRHNSLIPSAAGLDYAAASLTEPLAVSLTAVLNAEIPLGGSVLVLGPGPLGLMAVRLAKLRGAGWVGVTGRAGGTMCETMRLETAKRLGADEVIYIGCDDVEEVVKSHHPKGVDRVIVSSPPKSLYDAFKAIKFGGLITFFGLHFGDQNTIELDVNDMIFRKITLRPTFAEPAINFPISNRLLADGLVDAAAIVTHTFSWGNELDIFRGIIDGTEPVIKAVMLPHG